MKNKAKKEIINAKIDKITLNALLIKYKGSEYKFNYFLPNKTQPLKSYVYFVFINNELLYIGKGTGDRYKHTESLSTHSGFIRSQVRLSRESPDRFRLRTYIVLDGLDSRSAYAIESKYIKIFKPRGNIDDNPLYQNTKKGRARLSKELVANGEMGSKNSKKVEAIANKKIKAVKSRAKARRENYINNSFEYAVRDMDRQYLFWLRDNGYLD